MSQGVAQWLDQLGLGEFVPLFEQEQVELEDLEHLTDSDLKELGIPLGPRKRILNTAKQLSQKSNLTTIEPGSESEAERRQLTVMFCDLVGSTELTQVLDPEDLRLITLEYQDACKQAIERYEGFVARYMGDGLLAYFGYPQAHEDDAVRALSAGLDVVTSIKNLEQNLERPAGVELGVRVGIATGFVVVGDLIGEGVSKENAVVGETPNLAARLQGLAEPNTVVIGDKSQQLAGGRFKYEDMGKNLVKGIAEPVQVWRVVGSAKIESHFEALHKKTRSKLVGREIEVSLLKDRWQQAKSGEGQVIQLSGEAGIGKSHITQSLIKSLIADEFTRLTFQCSPYHLNTSLHPVIERIRRGADIQLTDSPAKKLVKLESILDQTGSDIEDVVPLFAALLSIPLEDRYPELDLNPERQKEKTMQVMAAQLEKLSHHKPLLIIFEDLHWIDPTSFEFLESLVERAQNLRILLITTFRPDFAPRWSSYTHITALTLNRFSRAKVFDMIKGVTGGKPFSPDLVEAIVEKTDGVPLFVEELTKTILESDILIEESDQFVISGLLESLSIPITLYDSLMARLDRLGKVKEVAYMASVIGREFNFDLLNVISPLSDEELMWSLEQLVDAELIFQTSRALPQNYIFKHALVQDAAYSSLLKTTRQKLHGRIGEALEQQDSEISLVSPELLAYHYTEARMLSVAIKYWFEAGNRAITRSANLEAVANFKKGLKLIADQPVSDEWLEWEMDFQLALSGALAATAGYAADETAETCQRAQELCRKVGDVKKLFRALYAVWSLYYIRPDQEKALELAQEFKSLAENEHESDQLVAAYSAVGHTCTTMGRYAQARAHFDKAIELYDPEQDLSLAIKYGEHPGIGSKIVRSTVDWMMGFPNTAVQSAENNLEEAKLISHPNTIAWAGVTLAMVHKDCRDQQMTRKYSEEVISYTTEHSIPYWRAMALDFLGWTMVDRGDIAAGMNCIEEGLEASLATGSRMRVPDFLSVLALGHLKNDQPDLGLAKIDEAMKVISETGERWNEVNIYCIKGRLLKSKSLLDEAESAFLEGINIAKQQSAKSYELRITTQLALLMYEQGKNEVARHVLEPVYSWFTEGFENRDQKDARALLQKLT